MKKRFLSMAVVLALLISMFTVSATTTSAATEFTASSYDFTKKMTAGINIGNTMDSTPGGNETGWGNPTITEDLVKALKAKGFDTIRLPVTWGYGLGQGVLKSDGSFSDNGRWLNRVKTVVDWIYNNGCICIVNTHHHMGWLKTWYDSGDGETLDEAKVQRMLNAQKVLWTNIANKFKTYGENLVFEAYNETRSGENNWSSVGEDHIVLQRIGQSFLDAVRATGGNNAKRYVLLNTFAAGFSSTEINRYKMPNDPANHIIFGVHSYDPQPFCFREYPDNVFKQADFDSKFKKPMERLKTLFLEKGIGVIMGECGAVFKNNESEMCKYADALVKKCYEYGVVPIWWENGVANSGSSDSFGLINRSTYQWSHDAVATKFVNCCKQYGANRPDYSGQPTTTTTTTTTTKATTAPTTKATTQPGPTATTKAPTTTKPTTAPTTQPTQPTPVAGKVFCAYNDFWWGKTEGWGAGMKTISDLQEYIDPTEDGINLVIDQNENWAQQAQIVYNMDRTAKSALKQAIGGTKKLMFTVKVNKATDRYGNNIVTGLAYEMAGQAIDRSKDENILACPTGQEVTFFVDVSNLTEDRVDAVCEEGVKFFFKNREDWNQGFAALDIEISSIVVVVDTPTTTTPPAPTRKVGDVNNDGVVNTLDVRSLLSMTLAGKTPAKGTEDFYACDVNKDGIVNTLDVRAMVSSLL